MRVFRKIIVYAAVIVVLVIAASVVLAKLFEDELTEYAIEGLNRRIRAKVIVSEIRLSFIKKFPDVSLELKDVVLNSVPDYNSHDFNRIHTDTLLAADHIFLRFNLIRLIKRQYIIKEVQVKSGKLNLFVDKQGKGNYRFWNSKERKGENEFLLELEDVNLNNIQINFDNRALDIFISGETGKCFFKGQFSRESYEMSAGIQGNIFRYSNQSTVFIENKKFSAGSSLMINPESINIEQGTFVLGGQTFLVNGKLLRPKPIELDLSFTGKRLDLENMLRYFLAGRRKIPDDIKAGGTLEMAGNIKGITSNTRMPWINASFSLTDGWVRSARLPHEIREIKTKGSYSNGIQKGPHTTLIQLNGLSMNIGNSRIGGDYSVYNLLKPDFNYKIKSDLDLSDILLYMKSDTLFSELKGRVIAEVEVTGSEAVFKDFKKSDILKYKYNANFRIEDVSIGFNEIPLAFKNFTGEALFTDYLEIKDLSGIFENSSISLNGRVDNLLEYIFTNSGNLWMDADLYSERLDLNHLRSINARVDKIDKEDSIFLPERLYLKSRFWFDELEIKNFRASQITGDLIYKPKRLNINHIDLLSMGGRISAEGMLEQKNDMHFLIKSKSDIRSVEINRAFSSFNNFGQEFIQERHIKGLLNGTVNFSTGMDEKMKIKKETILADCNIILVDGELANFEPMMKLSRFIEIEELENIKFSTLTNEIFIRNNEVVIPKMDIASTAADITASGVHGFNKNYTYKVKVAMAELRSNKSGKLQEQKSEFGVIEDDGLGKVYVYLIIDGTPEETNIRYDRREAIQNVRENLKEEKNELRKLLNEEFGLFKKDSSLNIDSDENETPDFFINWDETGDSVEKRDRKPDNNTEQERFIIEWDEDVSEGDTLIPVTKTRKNKRKK